MVRGDRHFDFDEFAQTVTVKVGFVADSRREIWLNNYFAPFFATTIAITNFTIEFVARKAHSADFHPRL